MAKRGLSRGKAIEEDLDLPAELPSLSLTKTVAQKEDNLEISNLKIGEFKKPRLDIPSITLDKNNGMAGFKNPQMNMNTDHHVDKIPMQNIYPNQPQNQINNGMTPQFDDRQQFGSFASHVRDEGMFNRNHGMNSTPSTFGGGSFIENNHQMYNGVDSAINKISQALQNQYRNGRIRNINEFFSQYDPFEQRSYQSWELEFIFTGDLRQDEILAFLNKYGNHLGINHQQLIQVLQSSVQIPPGITPRISSFASKQLSPQSQDLVAQIYEFFSHQNRPFEQVYDKFIQRQTFTQNDLESLLNRINSRHNAQQNIGELYNYFIIGNGYQCTKIGFLQALKYQEQQRAPGYQQNNNLSADYSHQGRNNIPSQYAGRDSPPLTSFKTATSFESLHTTSLNKEEHPIVQKLVTQVLVTMRGFGAGTFNQLLSKIGSSNKPYLDQFEFQDFCRKVGASFNQAESNTLLSLLDLDKRGMVKTDFLKQKVEAGFNSPYPSPLENYPPQNEKSPHHNRGAYSVDNRNVQQNTAGFGNQAENQLGYGAQNLNLKSDNMRSNNLNYNNRDNLNMNYGNPHQQSFGNNNAPNFNYGNQNPPPLQLSNDPASFGPALVRNNAQQPPGLVLDKNIMGNRNQPQHMAMPSLDHGPANYGGRGQAPPPIQTSTGLNINQNVGFRDQNQNFQNQGGDLYGKPTYGGMPNLNYGDQQNNLEQRRKDYQRNLNDNLKTFIPNYNNQQDLYNQPNHYQNPGPNYNMGGMDRPQGYDNNHYHGNQGQQRDYNFDIRSALDKIKQYLNQYENNQGNNKNSKDNLIYFWFNPSFQNQKPVVELQQFLGFLSNPFVKLSQQEIHQVTQTCLMEFSPRMNYQTRKFIDLQKFAGLLYQNDQGYKLSLDQHKSSYETLGKIYEVIRKYILNTGGNILRFFSDMDINQDNFISKTELKVALQKIGYMGVSDNEIEYIFSTFDQNSDGRISYSELCKQFAEFSNTKAIKDPNHWAFWFFENIRRYCSNTQKPLAELFNLHGLNITSLDQQYFISKEQLVSGLERNHLLMNNQMMDKLFALLDADQRHQYQVDFVHFAELVGINYQSQKTLRNLNEQYVKNPIQQVQREKMKKFYRGLYGVLRSLNMSTQNLKMMLKAYDRNQQQSIPFDDFVQCLKGIDVQRRIDFDVTYEVCKRHLVNVGGYGGEQIDYNAFLKNLEYQNEKYKVINLIFMTLQKEMGRLGVTQLYEVFKRYDRSGGLKQFDKDMLLQTLQAIGVQLNQYEIDMVLLEYDPDCMNLKLDFQTFEKDFEEYQKGQSALNLHENKYYQDFTHFQGNLPGLMQPPPQALGDRRNRIPTNFIKSLLDSIAKVLDSNPSYDIHQALNLRGIKQTGVMIDFEFQNWIKKDFLFREDDAANLYAYYDLMKIGEVRVDEFLIDLKDHIQNFSMRTKVTEIAQMFSYHPTPNAGNNNALTGGNVRSLDIYQRGFEEIFKAIVCRNHNTHSYFSRAAMNSDRINKDAFNRALYDLQLQLIREQDIQNIFDSMQGAQSGIVMVDEIDKIIRDKCYKSKQQMEDEVLEKIVRAFNGDDGFLLEKISEYDRTGRGLVDIESFSQFFNKNSPQHSQINQTDVKFLGMKYCPPKDTRAVQSLPVVNMNLFIQDFCNLRSNRNIKRGDFRGQWEIQNTYGNRDQGYQTNYDNFGGGHRNPLLPQSSKTNTRAEISRISPPHNFQLNLDPHLLEELAKGTYLMEKLVQDYFAQFTQHSQQGPILSESDFSNAIQKLNLGWIISSTNTVFVQIDQAFHNFQNKRQITPEEIDQAVCFGSKKSIDDMQKEVLMRIAKHAAEKNISLRQEIMRFQPQDRTIKLQTLKEIILNQIRAPHVMEIDVDLLCKKYIQNIPSIVPFERLLDDIEALSRTSFANLNASGLICEYIKKAVIVKKQEMLPFFQGYARGKPTLSLQDLNRACQDLGLIPEICDFQQIQNLMDDVDTTGRREAILDSFLGFVLKMAQKQTREMQDDILSEIASKAQGRNIVVDNLFRQDDRYSKGYVDNNAFYSILAKNFQVKDIDSRLIATRYQENQDTTNYTQFIRDVRLRAMNGRPVQANQPNVVGLAGPSGGNNEHQNRLREYLVKASNYVSQYGVNLFKELSRWEKGQATGTIALNDFYSTLQKNLTLQSNEIQFLADVYRVQTQGGIQASQAVDYRKFLDDMKQAGGKKYSVSLSKKQQNFYKGMGERMTQKNLVHRIWTGLLEQDPMNRYYLPKHVIEKVINQNGFSMDEEYFKILFSPLDQNSNGDYNYKQMFEFLIGEEKALQLFQGGLVNKNTASRNLAGVTFVMPQQPMGAEGREMDSIGRSLIASNKNYEEEFKRRMGPDQARSANPKINENDVYEVLNACRVAINTDQRSALFDFFQRKKSYDGSFALLEFLQAIGLPAQTLGPRGQKQLPRKILSLEERKKAQQVIFKIREELNKLQKKPQEIFELFKESQGDLTLPLVKFKQAIFQIGDARRLLQEQDYTLLQYYLSQEVQGEISFKKLYLAFVLLESNEPLKQEGAEEIQQYQKKLTEHLDRGIPIEILDLQHFLKENQMTVDKLLKQERGYMQRQEFENALKEAGYVPNDMQKLIKLLDTKGTMQSISVERLQTLLQKAQPALQKRNITQREAREKYAGFDLKVRLNLQRISEYMKKQNFTLQKMYEFLDENKDGTVEKQEFVTKLSQLNFLSVDIPDLGMIFDAMDINNDGSLSINEFALFLEGAQVTRMQRQEDLDPEVVTEMKQQIDSLFNQFDDNGDGWVTPDEIQKAMLALGQRITIEDARNMIIPIDTNGDGKLDRQEFQDLMLPRMKEELLSQEESLEDLRSLFLDADIDHSGTLTIDEIYSVILKLGAKVTEKELVELMNEIDVDRDGSLDIDEFIALMSLGDEMQFRNANAKATFINIKRARKLSTVDFFKNFKNLPGNFVPSFFTEKWVKYKKNLPSSAFVPQIDPKTLLYKDLFPVLKENLKPNQMTSVSFQPKVRPLATQLGCQILMEEAQGVPMPNTNQSFDARTQIVKRMVRVGLFDTIKKDFIHNSAQVNALYNQNDQDIWRFNAWKDNGTNPILFKAANRDDVVKPHVVMIFELCIAVLYGEKVQEVSCGWCQLEIDKLERAMTHKLAIKGGSPSAEMIIKDEDVHTNRTGMKYIMKVMKSKIESQLTVNIRPYSKFTEETQLHMDLLPSTCFIQKRLLYFVSGFRNYLGEKLIKESAMIHMRQPEGDVVISCFPRILDNPDICEQIINIWSEDVWSQFNQKQKINIELIMLKTQELIKRLYPVIYAEEFQFKESDYTRSAAGNQTLLRKREELIKSALCYGNSTSKIKAERPLESMTTFKPFTVRELEFEVWDSTNAKQDRYMRQYEELGLIQNPSNILAKDSSLIQNMNRPNQYNNQPPQMNGGQQPPQLTLSNIQVGNRGQQFQGLNQPFQPMDNMMPRGPMNNLDRLNQRFQ